MDSGQFMRGVPVQWEGGLWIPMHRPGVAKDFNWTVGAPVPVVSAKLAQLLTARASGDFQLLPVSIDSQSEPYALINVTQVVKCIDDMRSEEVGYWIPEDGRPEKVGKYRKVYGMRIEPDKVPTGANIFRPWGWTVVLVVSQELRDAMEKIGVTGAKFREV